MHKSAGDAPAPVVGPGNTKARRLYARGREGRARILATALDLVEQHGYEGATIAELARRTDLPGSSIYWHFTNKDELVAAAIAHSFEQRVARSRPWPERPDNRPLREQLHEALLALANDGQEADYNRVGLVVAMPRATAAVAAKQTYVNLRKKALVQVADWWRPALADLGVGDGGRLDTASDVMARFTVAMLDGRYLTYHDVPFEPSENMVLADMLVGIARYIAEGAELPVGDPLAMTPEGLRYPDPAPLSGADRLIAATIGALCEYGYPGTTVAKVCERADLPASSLYWHFADLDALIEAALDTAFAAWQAEVDEGAGLTAAADSTMALDRGFASMRRQPTAFLIGYGLLLRRKDTAGRRRFSAIRAQVTELRREWMATWLASERPEIGAAEREGMADILAPAAMVAADGLFLVETLTPRWPLSQAGAFVAAGFREAASQWVSQAA